MRHSYSHGTRTPGREDGSVLQTDWHRSTKPVETQSIQWLTFTKWHQVTEWEHEQNVLLTFPACHSMLYSLRSACTSVHSLYNCCINCGEARQAFRKRNHSNWLPQLTCLYSPTATRKVKTSTELSFFKAGYDTVRQQGGDWHSTSLFTWCQWIPQELREQPWAWSPLKRPTLTLHKRAKGLLQGVHSSKAKKYFLSVPYEFRGVMFRLMVSPSLTVAISINALFPSLNRIQIEKYWLLHLFPSHPTTKKAKRNFIFLWMLSSWRQRKLDYLPSWILKNYVCIHINCWMALERHAVCKKLMSLHYSVTTIEKNHNIGSTFLG